jgi:hypothetical protein
MKPKYKQRKKFYLPGIGVVKPFNGETSRLLPKKSLSWSHGLTHFIKENGEINCCGTSWFEENAQPITGNQQ